MKVTCQFICHGRSTTDADARSVCGS